MPNQFSDMGERSEFIRNFLFPDKSISKKEYLNKFIEHMKKTLKYPIYQI